MKNFSLKNSRYDFFLIWGHGLLYKNEILNIIASEKNFDILYLLKHKASNIKKLVKKVYDHDYIPFFHLRSKTKYLLKTSSEVMFVFVDNKNPKEMWKLGHRTGHIESELILKYKTIIRDRFNTRKNDRLSEDHVIHGSDNELQTHYILKYLGYNEGIRMFERHKNKPIEISFFIEQFKKYKIHEVSINKLICNTISHNNTITIDLVDSPQYKFLIGFEREYENYINEYLGIKIKAFHNLKKYKELSNSFNYLDKKNKTSLIVVKKINDKYMIFDGVHRASLAKFNGQKKLIVLEIL